MRNLSRLPAIILAAGSSSRMGTQNKLIMEVDRVPMIRRVVEVIRGAGLDRVYVVTGFEKEKVENCLKDCEVEFVFNGDYELGMGSSLAAGIEAAETEESLGFLVSLGDLPYLKSDTVARIVELFTENKGKKIVIPVYQTKRGHPIAFPERFSKRLKQLREDVGAKQIVEREGDRVVEVEVNHCGVVRDFDSLDSFEKLG